MSNQDSGDAGLAIAMISVHGLIRGTRLELGRDPDTGGQTKYVVELARELARQPDVARVDLLTRRIAADEVDDDYAEPLEDLGDGARIVRIDAGPPDEYIPKEQLWDHLDVFIDNALEFFRADGALPDVIHGHYADAGYVGSGLARLLGLPFVQTGHSLGRVKRRRLLASGLSTAEIDERYAMSRRIEAEEDTLSTVDRVITSTRQEIDEQYALYDHHQPESMRVIPPGTDLTKFHPPERDEWDTAIGRDLRRFLAEPDKPLILALSRPDPRKNVETLLEAYGTSATLREHANLVVVVGNRDDIRDLGEGAQEVLTELLLAVDRHDLHGRIAYPKHHAPGDVPVLYRLAAASGGVFVNPALTEPFGLTLIEAAASGLPVVATEDGGPQDIIANCENGELVDPLDAAAMATCLEGLLADTSRRARMAQRGLAGVAEHYAWPAHARRYLDVVRPLVAHTEVVERRPISRRSSLYRDRALFSDLDHNLIGDPESLRELLETLVGEGRVATFGIATGRRLDAARKGLREHGIPTPDVLITSGGTAIHHRPGLTEDTWWTQHIDHLWMPQAVRRVLADLPGLEPQPRSEQSRFKISYYHDADRAPTLDELNSLLHQHELSVNVTLSFGQYLDIVPLRASKGLALRHVAHMRGIPLERVLVAGGTGADEDMLRGTTLGVVVANRHDEELSHLQPAEHVHFARRAHAGGILEAIEHYDFFGACRAPGEPSPA